MIPPWDGVHPYVAHFPIALLSTAPVLVVLGLALPRRGRAFLWSALLLIVLGTFSAYLTISTGGAAAARIQPEGEMALILEKHEDLADLTLPVFCLLTLVFATMLIGPKLLGRQNKRVPRAVGVAAHLLFLVAYMTGCVLLTAAGHYGGVLVHEYGVHARLQADERGGKSAGHASDSGATQPAGTDEDPK